MAAPGAGRRRLEEAEPPPGGRAPRRHEPAGGKVRAALRVLPRIGGGRHELAKLPGQRRAVRGRRETAEGVPERRAEGIEGRDLPAREGSLECVAERGPEPQTCLLQPGASPGERNLQHPHGRGGGVEVHETLAVDVLVGIPSASVGGGEEPGGEVRVRELAAKELLHERKPPVTIGVAYEVPCRVDTPSNSGQPGQSGSFGGAGP